MAHGTCGLAAVVVLVAGAAGCTLPAKRKPPEPYAKPLTVTPPKPEPAKETPLPTVQPTGRNGTLNVPGTPTSGGTLRPTPPASPSIESPVLPTVPANPTPAAKPDAGLPVPPPPPTGTVDPMNISPPTPAKLDLPSLPN